MDHGYRELRNTTDSCVVDIDGLSGNESDASVWHRIIRHIGSIVLAEDDVGE